MKMHGYVAVILCLVTSSSALYGATAIDPEWASGADVAIAAGDTVILTQSTAELNSLTVSGTLSCSNWATCVSAKTFTVEDKGVVTVVGAFSESQMSNRVYVVCEDFDLQAGAKIDVDQKGWRNKEGRGSSTEIYGSGGYGGRGGGRSGYAHPIYGIYGSEAYGSVSEPSDPGSGSKGRDNHDTYVGLPGGGAVRIVAAGRVTINGSITAKGGDSSPGMYGGSSGGSVWISCRSVSGAGTISVAGGLSSASGPTIMPGGGGGRIALTWSDAAEQAGCSPAIAFDCGGAEAHDRMDGSYYRGEAGTLYLTDASFVPSVSCTGAGRITYATAPESLTIPELTLRQRYLSFAQAFPVMIEGDVTLSEKAVLHVEEGQTLTIGGNASVSGSGALEVDRNGALTIAGDLSLGNAGYLDTWAGATNETLSVWGVEVTVGGTMTMASGSAYHPVAYPTTGPGGATRLVVGSLVVADGASINGTGMGYQVPYGVSGAYTSNGPGGTTGEPGASHAGLGGRKTQDAYGDAKAPRTAGSSGTWLSDQVNRKGTSGGGQIWVEAAQTITVDGAIEMNGIAGTPRQCYYGSGAGGSIYLQARQIFGSGTLSARGGDGGTYNGGYSSAWPGAAGGGGGGYVTLRTNRDSPFEETFAGTIDVSGGLGYTDGELNSETGRYAKDYRGWPGVVTGLYNPGGLILLFQ